MITVDLRQTPITINELLQLASADPVLIVGPDGNEFVVEAADAFEGEVAELGQSGSFMAFLAERSREPGSVPLQEIEQRLAERGQ